MDALLDEIESLEAILMDDVRITRDSSDFPELIETTIFPTTGEDRAGQKFVCVTLCVMPKAGYPDEKPLYKLKNPRGLDDFRLNVIDRAIKEKLDECLGQPVVFDLIEAIREQLSESNLPSGQCVVCLYGFQEDDEFTKTSCFHFLHSYCLSCHIHAGRNSYEEELEKLPIFKKLEAKPFQATCPVCREKISIDLDTLRQSKPPRDVKNAPQFILTDDLKRLQMKMSRLYFHQKSIGGIIDLEAEESNVIAIRGEVEEEEIPPKKSDPAQLEAETNGASHSKSNGAAQKSNKRNGGHYGHQHKNRHQHHRHHSHKKNTQGTGSEVSSAQPMGNSKTNPR